MNGYLRPPVFWAMVAFATLLWLLCVFAQVPYAPYLLGIAILATIVEWGIEQNWLDRLHVAWLYQRIRWLDGELRSLGREMNEAREFNDVEELQALQIYYVSCAKIRQRLHGELTDLRYELEGAVEGVDYPAV